MEYDQYTNFQGYYQQYNNAYHRQKQEAQKDPNQFPNKQKASSSVNHFNLINPFCISHLSTYKPVSNFLFGNNDSVYFIDGSTCSLVLYSLDLKSIITSLKFEDFTMETTLNKITFDHLGRIWTFCSR